MAQPHETSVRFKVRVQPRSSRNQIAGCQAGTLSVRVTAPPHDGKANAAVVSLLSETLGVAKSRVRIVRGHTSRDKLVSVASFTLKELQASVKGLTNDTNEL